MGQKTFKRERPKSVANPRLKTRYRFSTTTREYFRRGALSMGMDFSSMLASGRTSSYCPVLFRDSRFDHHILERHCFNPITSIEGIF